MHQDHDRPRPRSSRPAITPMLRLFPRVYYQSIKQDYQGQHYAPARASRWMHDHDQPPMIPGRHCLDLTTERVPSQLETRLRQPSGLHLCPEVDKRHFRARECTLEPWAPTLRRVRHPGKLQRLVHTAQSFQSHIWLPISENRHLNSGHYACRGRGSVAEKVDGMFGGGH